MQTRLEVRFDCCCRCERSWNYKFNWRYYHDWKNKNQQPPTVFQHDSQFKYHKIYTRWAKTRHFPHSSLQRRFYLYRSFLAKFSLLRVTGGFHSIILNFEARLWGNLEAWTHRQVMQWNTCRFSVGKYYLLPTWAWKSSFPSCIW